MLRQLYLSLVRPHLEYAAPVWSPYLHKDINIFERTQQFASKMCTKIWDSSYNELLERLHLPTLAQRRLHLSSCTGLSTGYCIFLLILLISSLAAHHLTTLGLIQPFARTDSYLHSSNTVLHWNSLTEYMLLTSPSLSSFKHDLSLFTL